MLRSVKARARGFLSRITASRSYRIETELFEIKNYIQHVGSMVENTAINTKGGLETVLQEAIAETIARSLAAEARCAQDGNSGAITTPASLPERTWAWALNEARRDFPRQFADWRERLEAMENAAAITLVGNFANPSDIYSLAFRNFVNINATGSILDLGCGNMGRPIYLCDLPEQRLWGLEPLAIKKPMRMQVTQGIGEYLPWRDKSFDTLISATSVDHALSLDRSLAEIERVLAPHGRVLMWVGSLPGAKKFTPEAADYVPADRFHLFHIDRTWFEPLLLERFDILDRIVMWRQSHEHVFYKLQSRSQ